MIEILIIIAIFIAVSWLVWFVVEKKNLVPECFSYRPFICRICATFWTLTAISAAFIIDDRIVMGIGLEVLALLNAIAMKVHQINNTEEI